MSAIFGFSGPEDPRLLERMSSRLSHRGIERSSHSSPLDSVGFRSHFLPEESSRQGEGLWASASLTMAVAGRMYLDVPQDAATDEPRGLPPVRHAIGHGAKSATAVTLPLCAPDAPLSDVVRLYRRHGISFARFLRGHFVMAICDGGLIHLIRDGAGGRSIYFGQHEGRFLFGVEPKAVLSVPGFPRRLRPAAVAEYLTFSFVPGMRTMLQDLYELPAGHTATWDGKRWQIQRFFVFEDASDEEETRCRDDNYWTGRFRGLFARAVADRLPPNEPVGVFLSGGLDSSVVAAEVAAQHRDRVFSYAIHFGKKYPNELSFARAVADRCGTEHQEVLIQPRDFLPRLRQMIWHLDDPIGDPITMPNFELSARVSGQVRFAFNGEGGDPCFGGPKNLPMLLQHWYGGISRGSRFREQCYLSSYRRGYDEIHRILTPAWHNRIDVESHLQQILTPFFQTTRPSGFLDKLMAINVRLKGAHLILPKVERMTGAWGLTPLAPLFDEQLVRLSFAMPSNMKLRSGKEKIVIKQAYRDDLPAEVIERPKSGMRVPVHFWFQGELKRYARSVLGRKSLRANGIFDDARVRQLMRYDTEEGRGRYGLRLWMLVTFELWRRIVVEGEAP